MRKLVILSLPLLYMLACKPANDTRDYKEICVEFDNIDREMLDLIKTIRAKHKDHAKFQSNFNMEQVYWVQYRDTHLKAIFPEDWSRHYREQYGKELFNGCKCQEMTRMTKNRIKELELWLEGGAGNEDCPSLWKVN